MARIRYPDFQDRDPNLGAKLRELVRMLESPPIEREVPNAVANVLTGDAGPAGWELPHNVKTVVADASGGNFTILLPPSSQHYRREVTIFVSHSTAYIVTLRPSGADTINDAASIAVQAGSTVTLVFDGTNIQASFGTTSPVTSSITDLIGGILLDSTTIDFTYNATGPSITAAIIADSVSNTYLANMATNTIKARVTAGTGDPEDVAIAANQFLARASTGQLEPKTVTDYALTLLDDANAAAARSTLDVYSTSEAESRYVNVTGDAMTGALILSYVSPQLDFRETGVTADNGIWQMFADAEQFVFRVANDGITVASNILTVDRTGTTVDLVSFPNGEVSISSNLTVGGNLTVNGTATYVNTDTLAVEDPLIKLATANAADITDIGFYGLYVSAGSKYTGLFRDATDGKYRLFTGLTVEPTTTVDTGGAGYTVGTLVTNLESSSAIITGGTITGITDLAIADGGTGASTAADARTNLGLVAGGAGDIWVEKAGDTMTGALLVNASITAETTGEVFRSAAATTSPKAMRLANTGADSYFGIEGSVAGGYFTGSSAYATVVYANTQIEFLTGGAKRATIATNGNVAFDTDVLYVDAVNNRVGVGTASPGHLLSLYSAVEDGTALLGIVNANSATLQSFISHSGGTTRIGNNRTDSGGLDFVSGGAVRGGFEFGGNFSVDTNTLYVDAVNNRVGVGTASTSSRPHPFQVVGRIASIVSDANDTFGGVTAGTGGVQIAASYGSTGAFVPITLYTSDLERARILANGQFLIGTTSALNSFSELLGLPGTITAGDATASAGAIILQGRYSNGSLTTFGSDYSDGAPVIGYGVYPGTAATDTFRSSTGLTSWQRSAYVVGYQAHKWFTGAAQTVAVGSTVTLAEKMRLLNNGNLAVSGRVQAGTITDLGIGAAGDFVASRTSAPTTGVIYLGNSGSSYLYFDGANYFMPGGSLYVNGALSWNSGNDGAGSGLDADLLDGLQGTSYLATRGSVADTALDTTTARGMYAVSYTGFSKALLVINEGGSTGPWQIEKHYATNHLRTRSQTDSTTWSAWQYVTLTSAEQGLITGTIWHSANDGSGSGLDADLLDGNDSSAFATAGHNHDATYVNVSGDTMTGLLSVSMADGDVPMRLKATTNWIRFRPYADATNGGMIEFVNAAENAYVRGQIVANPLIIQGGNVLIGTTTDAGTKLLVSGVSSFNSGGSFASINSGFASVSGWSTGNYGVRLGATGGVGVAQVAQDTTAFPLALQPYGSNVLIGTTTDAGVKLYVDGTVATTGQTDLARTSGVVQIGQSVSTGDVNLQMGQGRSASGYAYIDLVGDTTYTDYGLRILRGNAGANAISQITHRGTGYLYLQTQDAGGILFLTNSTIRGYIEPGGNWLVGNIGDVGYKLHVDANVGISHATNPYLALKNTTDGTAAYVETTANIARLYGPAGYGTSLVSNAGAYNLTLSSAGALTHNGSTVWTAANDGAGSGLDADLLDGRQGANYAWDTLGALSAETLRNVHDTGLYTYNVNNASLGDSTPTVYWSVLGWGNGTAGTGQLAASWVSGGNDLYFRSLRDTIDNWWTWKKIWHESNDGSGSGLDADLLDGLNSASAATASTIVARDSNGYIFGVHFNQSSSNDENPTISQVFVQNSGDNYLRKASLAHLISQGSIATASNTMTLTNKTIDLGSNTLTGTKAQFNAALTSDDFIMASDLGSSTQFYTYTNTYTTGTAASQSIPTGAKLLVIRAFGGGGGGARNSAGATDGAGGGGAGVKKTVMLQSSDWGGTLTYTVGAAGTGRTATNGNGTAGGASTVTSSGLSFTNLNISAGGGGAGTTTGGGAGGTASGGDTNNNGTAGNSGTGAAAGEPGGNSGSIDSIQGIGGTTGVSPTAPGAGGAGQEAANGQNGAAGMITFTWSG